MAQSIGYFKRIFIFDKSWVSSSKGNQLGFALRDNAVVTIEDKTIEDYRKRQFPLMTNFKAELFSLEVGRPLLSTLITHAQANGAAAEFAGSKIGPTTYDGIWQFTGEDYLGIDFEYESSLKRRGAKVMLEASFDRVRWSSLLTAAQTNTIYNDVLSAFPYDNYEAPVFESLKYGASNTALINKDEIVDMSLMVKTIGNKTIYDRTVVSALEVNLDITVVDATKAKLLAMWGITPWAPSIELKQKIGSASSETHVFNEGVLGLKRKPQLEDSKRELTLNLTGIVPIFDVVASGTSPNQTYTYSA